ncbi:hypothetical protein ABKV19_007270 [Rosa sericea]
MATSQTSFQIYMLIGMMTRRLKYDNFITWSYQFQTLLEGQDLFGYIDGNTLCPTKYVITDSEGVTGEITAAYKIWKKTDKALLSLLVATLDDEIMDIVVGCKSSREAWLSLQQRFSNPSRANIMQLKIDLQTIKKGNDSIERYLIRVKRARYQLASVGVTISDEDIVVVTLNGLPAEYAMIKTVIRARDTLIPLENLRSQLLAAERDIEGIFRTHSHMSAMVTRSNSQRTHFYASDEGDNREKYKKNLSGSDKCNGSSFNSWPYNSTFNSTFQNNGSNKGKSFAECQICRKKGHTAVNCFYRNDIPPNHPSLSVVVCQICGLKGHAALDCHYRSKFAFQRAKSPSNLTAMFACNTNGAHSSSVSAHGSSSVGTLNNSLETHIGVSPAVVGGGEQNVINNDHSDSDVHLQLPPYFSEASNKNGPIAMVAHNTFSSCHAAVNSDVNAAVNSDANSDVNAAVNSTVDGGNVNVLSHAAVNSNVNAAVNSDVNAAVNSDVNAAVNSDANSDVNAAVNSNVDGGNVNVLSSFSQASNKSGPIHFMLTRAKNEIAKKLTFQDLCAYDESAYFNGFTSVLNVQDATEPKTSKAAVRNSEWDSTMNKELGLRKQGISYWSNEVFLCKEKYAKDLIHRTGMATSRAGMLSIFMLLEKECKGMICCYFNMFRLLSILKIFLPKVYTSLVFSIPCLSC